LVLIIKIMNFIKCSLVAAMALVLAGCVSQPGSGSRVSAAEQQKRQQALAASDHLIVPGERIGPVRLGMGMDEVVATLGQPDYAITLPYQGGRQEWKYDSLNLAIYFRAGSAPWVDTVETVAWNDTGKTLGNSTWVDVDPVITVFQTDNGIGLGASSFQVRRAYSSYGYQDTGGYGMNYTQLGVYFGLQSDRRVTTISVTSRQ
ncbi:MAG: hypothetical protein KGJ37_01485, partial [Verrucomicrobiota bacterium]|nr:hypothetical protein [Verrucomicrobiota bacterium]